MDEVITTMAISENKKHDLLLAITSLIIIIFITGLAVPPEVPTDTTIIAFP